MNTVNLPAYFKTVILANAGIQLRRGATKWGPRVREDDGKTFGSSSNLLLEWQAISPHLTRTEWPKTLPAS
jgi:hypothetical protein